MQVDYLLRMVQVHESFRRPEIEAIAKLINAKVEIIDYDPASPFCILRFHPVDGIKKVSAQNLHVESRARQLIARSILAKAIYELWGVGTSYLDLHANVHQLNDSTNGKLWEKYRENVKFKFDVDSFYHKRSEVEKRAIINEFAYLGFEGKIDLRKPDEEWGVLEEWIPESEDEYIPRPIDAVNGESNMDKDENMFDPRVKRKLKRIFLGRKIGSSSRRLIDKHDLKKRPYISTTSMDAELALVTATVALAAPGKLFLDPFVGTGGFMIAAAEWGALTLGSDIDGRSFRGHGLGIDKGVGANFQKYKLTSLFGDCITSDLTNTPFRNLSNSRWLDGIVCDPPYGVREGLKVLGTRPTPCSGSDVDTGSSSSTPSGPYLIDGVPAHTLPGYIAPKRPYSFERMLNNILDFAAHTLVDGGRLAFWMPSANENEYGEEEVTAIPLHPLMDLKHECIQRFNKWSRRLLVYERKEGKSNEPDLLEPMMLVHHVAPNGFRADELNPFRKRYFEGFVDRPDR